LKISQKAVRDELRAVEDPEIGLNVVDLGLIYEVRVGEDDAIEVDYTLTYYGCPAGPVIHQDIVDTLQRAFGTNLVTANLVWKPMWGPERMSEEARVMLGYPV
jgi:metal-sulfur cluster biosynthetic enzyme